MVAASLFMRSASARYSYFTPDRSRERNTVTIIAKSFPKETPSFHARLDCHHVVVGEAEMVADLVHQHMGHNGAERLVVLGPVEQDRHAIEPDHVGHMHRRAFRLERQTDALEQAKE